MAALKGQALLDYLAANEGQARDTLIEGAGYTILRNGKTSLQRTKFFEALAEANGHTIVSPLRSSTASNGKVPTYRLKVGPTGLVPVGGAYTSLCNMEPGTFVKVIIEDGVIVLEPEESSATAPTPPVAQLASVA
jgi:hypothetical protein